MSDSIRFIKTENFMSASSVAKAIGLLPAMTAIPLVPGPLPAAPLPRPLIADAAPKAAEDSRHLAPGHPRGRPGWSARPFISARPSPACCGHLRSESVGERVIYFFLSSKIFIKVYENCREIRGNENICMKSLRLIYVTQIDGQITETYRALWQHTQIITYESTPKSLTISRNCVSNNT